jgi:hypothetical protein
VTMVTAGVMSRRIIIVKIRVNGYTFLRVLHCWAIHFEAVTRLVRITDYTCLGASWWYRHFMKLLKGNAEFKTCWRGGQFGTLA